MNRRSTELPVIPSALGGDHSNEVDLADLFCQAVSEDLFQLAWLQDKEITRDGMAQLVEIEFPDNLGLKLVGAEAEEVLALTREAVQELTAAADKLYFELAADYTAIYLMHGFDVSPCESVWFDEDGLIYQEPMFQIRDAMQHYGLQSADWRQRSEDHLVMQLLFVAYLMETGTCVALQDAARFLDEHTLRWLGKFANRISSRCETKFYAGLVSLTHLYLDQLRNELALILDQTRPTTEEIEKRLRSKQPPPTEQANCGPLCTPRDDPKPNRRRYP